MKVPYFELLNPVGFMVDGIGRIHSPKLRAICERGYKNYQYALTILLMTPHDFFEGIAAALHEEKNPYDELPQEQKDELNIFDLLIADEQSRGEIITALGFFIDGAITFEPTHRCFLVNAVQDETGALAVDGLINAENWTLVCDVCLQCAYLEPPKDKQVHKYKDEKTRKKFEEFYRKKAEYEKNKRGGKKADPDYELANIISALATYHDSLNMANIWDLTVYQVHDTFNRQRMKQQIDITDFNYSVWGGKDHQADLWFKKLT